MKQLAIIMLCLACAACGQMEVKKYEPEGKQAFARDQYECERDARGLNADACTQMDMYEKCMQSKGYRPIQGTGNKGLCEKVF